MRQLSEIFGYKNESDDEILKRNLLIRVILLTSSFGITWSYFYYVSDLGRAGAAVLGYSLVSLSNLLFYKFFNNYKQFRRFQLVLILLLPLATQLSLGSYNSGSGVIFNAILCPLGALLFESLKTAKRFLYLFLLTLALAGLYEYLFPSLVLEVKKEIIIIFFVINFAAAAIVVFLLLEYFVAQRNDFQQKLRLKNEYLTDSIVYAKRIQEAILPQDKLIQSYLQNSFVLYLPKDIVSGDFYWFHHTEDEILYAVVDCTGHGVPGAFMSIVGSNGLNRAVREEGLTKPGEMLDALNGYVSESIRSQSDKSVQDGMDLSVCNLNLKNHKLQFAGAMSVMYITSLLEYDSPHLSKKDTIGGLFIYEVKGDKQAIGDAHKSYKNKEIQLSKGDSIYTLSDGFPDQFGGARDRKYNYKRLRSKLLMISSLSMEKQREELLHELNDWKGEREQLDDICIIGVRV